MRPLKHQRSGTESDVSDFEGLSKEEALQKKYEKLLQQMEKTREGMEHEKKGRYHAEEEIRLLQKKMAIISDHMEKLMSHLKHEAASKVRGLENLRTAEKDTLEVKQKYSKLQRRSNAKDRLIVELREGSKVLEDQLRLMDEKYLELRVKLDWARDNSSKKIKKAEKEAADLRTKFVLVVGSGASRGIGSGLGSPPQGGSMGSLPDIYTGSGSISDEFPFANSVATAKTSASKMTNAKKKKVSPLSNSHQVHADPEVETGRILEKLRLKQGKTAEFSDDKLRQLATPYGGSKNH